MNDITFISLPQTAVKFKRLDIPISIHYLANYFQQQAKVEIVDLENTQKENIPVSKYYAIQTYLHNIETAREISQICRKINSESTLIAGGRGAISSPELFFSDFDIIISDYRKDGLFEVLSAQNKQMIYQDRKKRQQIMFMPNIELIQNRNIWLPCITNYNCKYKCSYCDSYSWELHDISLGWITTMMHLFKSGIDKIYILSKMIMFDNSKLNFLKNCDISIKMLAHVHFGIYNIIKQFKPEYLKEIIFDIPCFDENILCDMQTKTRLSEILEAFQNCEMLGFNYDIDLFVGIKGETMDIVKRNMDIINKFNPQKLGLTVFKKYPNNSTYFTKYEIQKRISYYRSNLKNSIKLYTSNS